MKRQVPDRNCAARSTKGLPQKTMPGDRVPAISAMVLAFLASQHHNFMMLLLAFGLSDAAMSFMSAAPIVRNVMLGLSLAMIAVIAWQIRDRGRSRSLRLMGAVSLAVTVGLSAWSISRFGW